MVCVGRCHHPEDWTWTIADQQIISVFSAAQLVEHLPESGRSWVQFPAGAAIFGTHTKMGTLLLTKIQRGKHVPSVVRFGICHGPFIGPVKIIQNVSCVGQARTPRNTIKPKSPKQQPKKKRWRLSQMQNAGESGKAGGRWCKQHIQSRARGPVVLVPFVGLTFNCHMGPFL